MDKVTVTESHLLKSLRGAAIAAHAHFNSAAFVCAAGSKFVAVLEFGTSEVPAKVVIISNVWFKR